MDIEKGDSFALLLLIISFNGKTRPLLPREILPGEWAVQKEIWETKV